MKNTLALLFLGLCGSLVNAQELVTEYTLAPPGTRAYFNKEFFGVHAHRPDQAGRYPGTPFGAWRTWDGEGTWSKIQPDKNLPFKWADMDRYMGLIEKTPGTRVLVTLGMTPTWAAIDKLPSAYSDGNASMPSNPEDWRKYVRAVAQRYGTRVEAYEIWNEANTDQFWNAKDPKKLVTLACIAYTEIKNVSRDIKVIAPSGTGAYPGRTKFVKDFLDNGGDRCIDVVAYHLYTGGSQPENFVLPLVKLRQDLSDAGYGRFPLWNTESGYVTPGSKWDATKDWATEHPYNWASRLGDVEASNFVVRSMLLGRAIGFERFYHYAWDNAALGHVDLGSGMPRESANVITRFYRLFGNGGAVETCKRSKEGVWTCAVRMNGGKAQGQVVWVDAHADKQLQLYAVPENASVSDFHSEAAVTVIKGKTIKISASPALLAW